MFGRSNENINTQTYFIYTISINQTHKDKTISRIKTLEESGVRCLMKSSTVLGWLQYVNHNNLAQS